MLRLRQIALISHDLISVETNFRSIFGLDVCHRDPGVEKFGLKNFLMPLGNSFIEVVAPFQDTTAGGRYLKKRGSSAGYMVIMQTDDMANARARMKELNIRLVLDGGGNASESDGIQLHPKDLPGAIAELRWNTASDNFDGPWAPAGTDWLPHKNTSIVEAVRAVEINSLNHESLALQWSAALARPIKISNESISLIELDDAVIRFKPLTGDRTEGLNEIDIQTTNFDHVTDAARDAQCFLSDTAVQICGVQFNLIAASEYLKLDTNRVDTGHCI